MKATLSQICFNSKIGAKNLVLDRDIFSLVHWTNTKHVKYLAQFMLCITFGLESGDTNAIIGGPHTAVRCLPHPRLLDLLPISFLSFCRVFVKTEGLALKLRLKRPSRASAQTGCKRSQQRLITTYHKLSELLLINQSEKKKGELCLSFRCVCLGSNTSGTEYALEKLH